MTAKVWLRSSIAAALLAVASVASAQSTQSAQSVTTNDIQRLQDQVYQAGSDLNRMRSTDSSQATRLETELDDLRDEVVYLKVKMRKDGTVSRSEYGDLRDRIQTFRSRTRGDSGSQFEQADWGRTDDRNKPAASSSGGYDNNRPSSQSSQTSRSTIPVGQEIDVRLQKELTSDTAQVEDRFEATTVVDLYRGNEVIIPAGSTVRGIVSSVNRASRTDRKGSLTVAFDQVTVNGRSYPMRGTVTEALESEGMKGEIGRIGAGSAVGAIIGGILGGGKGALLGVLIGGGGTIAATEGKDVHLEPGTVLRVRMDTPPDIRSSSR